MSPQSECSVLDRQPEAPDLRLTNSLGDVSTTFARGHLCAFHRTIPAPLLSTSFTTCFQNELCGDPAPNILSIHQNCRIIPRYEVLCINYGRAETPRSGT